MLNAALDAAQSPDAAGHAARLTFGIPLRCAATARDWDRVCRLLDRTIASALAQVMPDGAAADIAVIVACHEVPDSIFRDDPRVAFVPTDIARPTSFPGQLRDKRDKKLIAARAVCARGGGYIMILDADDLVSNRIAAHVLGDDNRRGYLIDRGLVFDVGRQRLERTDLFDQRCGSCGIFWLGRDDARPPDDWASRLAIARHKEFAPVARAAGRALDPVPFVAGLYVFNNGENISIAANPRRDPRVGAVLARLARTRNRLLPGRRVPRAVREEFGLSGPLYD